MAKSKRNKSGKGRRVGRVVVSEMTVAAKGKNGHGVVLKSETDMADNNFLELDNNASDSTDADLAAALDAAEPNTEKAHGEDAGVTAEDVAEAADLGGDGGVSDVADEGEVGQSASEFLSENSESEEPEVESAGETSSESTETVPPAAEAGGETQEQAESNEEEITEERIGAEVLSFAMGLARASEDTSDAVAIAKAIGSLEFLANDEKVISRLKEGSLNLVVRKSCAAALGHAILALQGVKGSAELTEMSGQATRLFKSLRVESSPKTEASSPMDRLVSLRKSLGVLDSIGRPTRKSASAGSNRPAPESNSRTEPRPAAPQQDEGGYLEDINE
jgi:hypothetical protein